MPPFEVSAVVSLFSSVPPLLLMSLSTSAAMHDEMATRSKRHTRAAAARRAADSFLNMVDLCQWLLAS